jgi:hypothetical protein
MFGIAVLLSGRIIFNFDKLDINLKETVTLADLLYNRISLLFICFFTGAAGIFFVNHFKIKGVSDIQKIEYIN